MTYQPTVRKLIRYAILLLAGISLYLVYQSIANYVDPFSMCLIDIRTTAVRGDTGSIKSALRMLKKDDPASYENLCRYVRVVNEKRCRPGDPRVDSAYYSMQANSCYVRGSKTVYIAPIEDRTSPPLSVLMRSKQLASCANLSAGFWQSRKQ